MYQKRALIAMSGGVDSSVAALLAKEQGLECMGATALFCNDLIPQPEVSPVEDARAVARGLEMPFSVIHADRKSTRLNSSH